MSTNADTGTPRATRPTTFHADNGQELEEYRSLSLLALVSLIVGLAAPLCFAAPLMMVLPLVGTALALVALRHVASSEGRLAGRGAALSGLALCLISLLAVVSYSQVTRLLRERQAKQFGLAWIESLLAGDTQRAFRLTTTGTRLRPSSAHPGETPTNPYDEFVASPLVHDLTTTGANGLVRFVDTLSYERQSPDNCVVHQRFVVIPATSQQTNAESHGKRMSVDLTLQRARLPGESQSRWLVVDYTDESQNAATSDGP
jgi:hypothetical protein